MRSVLASLAVIAKPGEVKKASAADEESSKSKAAALDKDAIYAEMRSSKTMKRKWKETSAARPPKPAASGASDAQGESDVYA